MLLNLSNHPSSQWPEVQLQTAIRLYGALVDLPFPVISPTFSSTDLDLLVHQFEQTIMGMNPAAVHIMGEMTFTFRLVNVLKAKSIRCLASTTERIATVENGVKTSQFKFIQFRNY